MLQMLMVASNIPSKQGTFTKNICTCQWKQKIVSGNIGILAHIFISGTYAILVHSEAEKSKTFRGADLCAQKLSGRQKSA